MEYLLRRDLADEFVAGFEAAAGPYHQGGLAERFRQWDKKADISQEAVGDRRHVEQVGYRCPVGEVEIDPAEPVERVALADLHDTGVRLEQIDRRLDDVAVRQELEPELVLAIERLPWQLHHHDRPPVALHPGSQFIVDGLPA